MIDCPFSPPLLYQSFMHTAQGWVTDFTGTLPFPALCESAALTAGTTSALLEETAREGWMMQFLH